MPPPPASMASTKLRLTPNQQSVLWVALALAAYVGTMWWFVPGARSYFSCLLDHTITLLAGCGATVVLGLIEKHILRKPLSPKWEVVILGCFIFFAGFQAWKDQRVRAENAETKVRTAQFPDPVIRKALGSLVDDGLAIQTGWLKQMEKRETKAQFLSADKVRPWHSKVETYLKTIPNGDSYLRRFRIAPSGVGSWPFGIMYDLGGTYNQLVSDLNRIGEFISDPNLGRP